MPDDAGTSEEMLTRLEAAAGVEYEILRPIGAGGMGQVFLARDRRLGRLAALKVLPPLDAMRAARAERFRREAETVAQLSHPNIVPVFGAGGDAATPWFAMAYVEGETLEGRLAKAGALPPGEAVRIATEVGGALAYAHRRGVIHRDVKPSNVLIDAESGRAMIADFGIARALDTDGMTQSGIALGTPGYMAPEQASGSNVDARVDQYALGLLLYEMLMGRRFEADFGAWPSDPAVVRRALRQHPPLAEVVSRATALRREGRYTSVDDMLAALERGSARGSSRRWQIAAAALAALALGAVGIAIRGLRDDPVVAAAPETGSAIALLPFDGDSAAADSLQPLLRYQLEGFGAVRIADPRVFDPPRGADAAVVRAAARRAGAAWVLHGLITGGGGARAILVRAVDVASGRAIDLGRVASTGIGIAAADSIVLLVARSDAAQALGLSASAALAPGSVEAARAFAAAEAAFRRADYAAAARDYGRAAALDSGFALARYKRFLAELQAEPTEAGMRAAVAEIREIVGRVGPLERELLAAYLQLFDSADVAGAEARLSRLVAREPAFLDGWFVLAEVRYHFGALAGLPPESTAAAFERALVLWPGAMPAEMHLVTTDLWAGREDAARARIARYLAVDSTSTMARVVALGAQSLFGGIGERRALLARLPAMEERVVEVAAITGVSVARDRTDIVFATAALEEIEGPAWSRRVRREAASFRVAALLSQGRWRDAEAALAQARRTFPDDADLACWPQVAAALGFGRGAARPRAVPACAAPRLDAARVPFAAFASGWLTRYRGGLTALERGDTAAALAAFAAQDLLVGVGDAVVRGPVWLAHGNILAARGDRDGATRYFQRAANLLTLAEPPFDAVRDSAIAARERQGGTR